MQIVTVVLFCSFPALIVELFLFFFVSSFQLISKLAIKHRNIRGGTGEVCRTDPTLPFCFAKQVHKFGTLHGVRSVAHTCTVIAFSNKLNACFIPYQEVNGQRPSGCSLTSCNQMDDLACLIAIVDACSGRSRETNFHPKS